MGKSNGPPNPRPKPQPRPCYEEKPETIDMEPYIPVRRTELKHLEEERDSYQADVWEIDRLLKKAGVIDSEEASGVYLKYVPRAKLAIKMLKDAQAAVDTLASRLAEKQKELEQISARRLEALEIIERQREELQELRGKEKK